MTHLMERAAKLVAIYLKSMIVCGPDAGSKLAHIAHPPIDSILLKNISENINKYDKFRCLRDGKIGKLSWTKLNEKQYFDLINTFRRFLNGSTPFWHLEKFWTIYR